MKLTALTKEQCEQIRKWRNADISMYRTSFYITEEMQENFYHDVICNRKSDHRYYAVIGGSMGQSFIGMVGLVNISLENRNAEISIVINPEFRKKGHGDTALVLLLKEGFNKVNLDNIYGECYECSPFISFWNKIIIKYGLSVVSLPERKYFCGRYYDSIYFTFGKKILDKWVM